nr:type II toxin-antitoxin system PemK/MazF family toxin [Armatimonadota bacterium]
ILPCTTYVGQRIYPSQVIVHAPEGGLIVDSVVLAEQISALSKTRLLRQRGSVSPESLSLIDKVLAIALDLKLRV